MKLNALMGFLAVATCVTAGAKGSLCEDPDAKVYSAQGLSDVGEELVSHWMEAQPPARDLSLIVLKRKPDFLDSQLACEPGILSFDSGTSVLKITRRCHLENRNAIFYSYSFVACEKMNVPIAARPIPRLATVEPGVLQWEEHRVAYTGNKKQMDLGSGGIYRTRRAIHEGAVLDFRNLELRPVIERKQAVTIRSGRSGLSLELPGVALMDGWVGDVVRVRSKTDGNVLDAKVESASVVRVDG